MSKDRDYQAKSIGYKQLIMICLSCLLVLAGINLIAEYVYGYIWFPSSYTQPRNPFFLRGWEQYTAPLTTPKPDNTYRVIVIANSQGFMQEHAEDDLGYATLLKQLLQDHMSQNVEVLNWAAPASNAAEQIILAARAIEHQPDLILWVLHNDNLVRAYFRPFSFYSTDIPRLAYHPEVRQYLSQAFLSAHQGYDPLEWLNVRTGVGKMVHVFEADRYLKWWWIPKRLGFGTHLLPWVEQSTFYANEFYETVNRAPQPIPIAVVSMPLNKTQYSSDEWAEMILLDDRLAEIYEPLDNIEVYDAIDLIPKKQFYTSTHMRPPGHQMFADWLYKHVFATRISAN